MKARKYSANAQRFLAAKSTSTALVLLGILFLPPDTAMAEVFKCKVGGSTIYQGLPCDGKMEKKSSDTATAGTLDSRSAAAPIAQASGAGKLTLAQIYASMIAASAEQRKASADHDKAVKAISKTDTGALERAHNMYHARMDAAESTKNELSKELRRRCPGGANLNANSQQCK
ncbi:MAG: hypothetical protein ABI644_15120 [Arenimonas sp.]